MRMLEDRNLFSYLNTQLGTIHPVLFYPPIQRYGKIKQQAGVRCGNQAASSAPFWKRAFSENLCGVLPFGENLLSSLCIGSSNLQPQMKSLRQLPLGVLCIPGWRSEQRFHVHHAAFYRNHPSPPDGRSLKSLVSLNRNRIHKKWGTKQRTCNSDQKNDHG
jgi:hypothetical protein